MLTSNHRKPHPDTENVVSNSMLANTFDSSVRFAASYNLTVVESIILLLLNLIVDTKPCSYISYHGISC